MMIKWTFPMKPLQWRFLLALFIRDMSRYQLWYTLQIRLAQVFHYNMRCILQTAINESVVEVSVDDESVSVLWELGLPAACPQVQKLTISCSKSVRSDIIKEACTPFPHLAEFHVEGKCSYPRSSIQDSASFCDVLVLPCPQLVKLSLGRLYLGNGKAGDILRGMSVHEQLNSITYVYTWPLVVRIITLITVHLLSISC